MNRINEEKTIDPVDSLPAELKSHIFGFLTPVDLSRAAQVNRSWKDIADDDFFWKALVDTSKEKSDERLLEVGLYKQLFIKYLEYRQNDYLASDKAGRDLCATRARKHFQKLKQKNAWDVWQERQYRPAFQALHKDHPLVIQVLDIVCTVSHRDFNNTKYYGKAFNYLYEQNALNKRTIACIAKCVNDKRFLKKIDVEHYAYFIVTFYRANILSKDNLDAVKASFNPHKPIAEAFDIVLEALKYEPQTIQKAIFPVYRDRLIALSKTCDESISLVIYAGCMRKLIANGIRLSNPKHVIIYDVLLKLDSVSANSYSYAFVILHKAGLLIGPDCKLLWDLILQNPRKQRTWRAEYIIVNYVNHSLMPYLRKELKELGIDPYTVAEALKKLDRLLIDFERARKAVDDVYKLGIDLDAVRAKLDKFSCHYCKESDTDSGIGIFEYNDFPASSPSASPKAVEPPPLSTSSQAKLNNQQLSAQERLFNIFLNSDLPEEEVNRFYNAVKSDDVVQSFEVLIGFLLDKKISIRLFLRNDFGAAAIAERNGHYQLAFFIRMAAKLNEQLYGNPCSLTKRLPEDNRTQAAKTYMDENFRPAVFSALRNYLIKKRQMSKIRRYCQRH